MQCVTLNNGSKMPLVGLGTFQLKDPTLVQDIVQFSIETGYKLIDTAAVYKNEVAIGQTISNLISSKKLKREDIFITTKLGPKDFDKSKVENAIKTSLNNLKCTYIDLYLIHWPGKQGLKHDDPKNAVIRKEVWSKLEEIYHENNKIRAIGISNFTVNHLNTLLEHCSIKPAVLQSEFHPDYQQHGVIDICRKHNIHFQSYSSLGQAKLLNDNFRFTKFSNKYKKSEAQILLRWALQKGCSIIPKSSNKNHILENINIFEFNITDEDMKEIDDCGRNIKYAWNAESVV